MVTVTTLGVGRDSQNQSLLLDLQMADAGEVAENA